MLKPGLLYALLVFCGAGLLTAWAPHHLTWYFFGALIFGLLLVWSVAWAAGKVEARWTWLIAPLLAVVCWGFVQEQLQWSVYAFNTEVDTLRWAVYLVIFFLAFQLSGETKVGIDFRALFAIYAFVLAIVSMMQYFLGNGRIFWMFEPGEPAAFGPFLNRDHFASFAVLALPVATVTVNERAKSWIYFLVAPVLFACVIASASRAGFVCVALEVVFLAVRLRLASRTALAVVVPMVAFGFVVGWGNLFGRLMIADPYADRREVVRATIEMIRTNPWRGFGLGSWTTVYPAHAYKDFGVFMNAAHNDWLQWWADGGVPMFGCLLVLFGASLLVVRRVPWALGIPIVCIHSLIDFPLQGKFLPAIVFLVFGVAARKNQTLSVQPLAGPSATPNSKS